MDTQIILPLSRAAAAGGALGALRRGDKRRRRLRRPRPPRPRRQAPPHPRPGLPRARTRMHARTCIHTHTIRVSGPDPSQRRRSESAAQIRVCGADPSQRRRPVATLGAPVPGHAARPPPWCETPPTVRVRTREAVQAPGGTALVQPARPAGGKVGVRSAGSKLRGLDSRPARPSQAVARSVTSR